MTPVRLEPAAPRSQVKHSTTETLPAHIYGVAVVLNDKDDKVIKFVAILTGELGNRSNCRFIFAFEINKVTCVYIGYNSKQCQCINDT